MTLARAPGKVILFGEHAVVYGRPAIAVPVTEVQATARVEPGDAGQYLFYPGLVGPPFLLYEPTGAYFDYRRQVGPDA